MFLESLQMHSQTEQIMRGSIVQYSSYVISERSKEEEKNDVTVYVVASQTTATPSLSENVHDHNLLHRRHALYWMYCWATMPFGKYVGGDVFIFEMDEPIYKYNVTINEPLGSFFFF